MICFARAVHREALTYFCILIGRVRFSPKHAITCASGAGRAGNG